LDSVINADFRFPQQLKPEAILKSDFSLSTIVQLNAIIYPDIQGTAFLKLSLRIIPTDYLNLDLLRSELCQRRRLCGLCGLCELWWLSRGAPHSY
jgi:hypothetical protein